MKHLKATAGALAFILIALIAPLGALAQGAPQYAPWRDYVLIVESATDNPEDITYYDQEKPDARFVAVHVSEMSKPIKTDDIVEAYTDFAVKDAKGNEYRAESFGVSTIRIVNGELSLDVDQDSFTLFFDVPEGIPVDELTLYVDTAVKTEWITVPLHKVIGDSVEPAPAPAPVEENLSLGRMLVYALGEKAYETTLDYLEEGNVLKNGSNSSAAKGLQTLLRAHGANISADGKLGSKSIAALNEYGVWFAPLDENGKLSTVDAKAFEDFLLMLVRRIDRTAASALLEVEANADERLALLDAAEQALLGNYYTAQQLYEEMGGAMQSDLRAALCPQAFPRTGQLYRNDAYPSKRCDLTISVGGDDGEATYIKIYTLSDDLVLTAFIPANKSAQVSLPADSFIVKAGSGTQWYGEAEAFGEGDDAYYRRLYLESGEDTITLEGDYSYTLSLGVSTTDDGDDVSSRPESWSDF